MGGAVKSIFSPPKPKKAAPLPSTPEPPPPPPERSADQVARAAERQRRRLSGRRTGRRSTGFTGSTGIDEASQSFAVSSLGGVG